MSCNDLLEMTVLGPLLVLKWNPFGTAVRRSLMFNCFSVTRSTAMLSKLMTYPGRLCSGARLSSGSRCIDLQLFRQSMMVPMLGLLTTVRRLVVCWVLALVKQGRLWLVQRVLNPIPSFYLLKCLWIPVALVPLPSPCVGAMTFTALFGCRQGGWMKGVLDPRVESVLDRWRERALGRRRALALERWVVRPVE